MATFNETEAGQKWCPFARAHWSAPPAGYAQEYQGNRFFKEDGVTLDIGVICLGSRCAAWRWYSNPEHGDKRLGYCGLAGDLRHAT